MPGACKITATPTDLNCDLRATPGDVVTLEVRGTTGSILFQNADYNGTSLSPLPASQITFTVVAGTTNLDLVLNFSRPSDGAGTLNEVCTDNTKLADVTATSPAIQFVICA